MNMLTRVLTTTVGLAAAAGGLLAPAPPAAAATAACGNSDLTASYHSDAGMGHSYGWIVLRNTSGHVCHTGGFGGISYVGDGNGTQIGASAIREGGGASTYVLQPQQRLRSRIDELTAGNYPRKTCRPRHVDGFRIYVPNATRSQYVAHPTTGCENHHVKLIRHRAYVRPHMEGCDKRHPGPEAYRRS